MFLSVFDVFKIGIGPSSSHTMGPMSAAARFLAALKSPDLPRTRDAAPVAIAVSLHGSLAFTGIGHGSDKAVILGLAGEVPQTVDPDAMEAILAEVAQRGSVSPPGHPSYRFRPATDLVLEKRVPLPGHPNGMRFEAYDASGHLFLRQDYFSIGGGFVVTGDELASMRTGPQTAVEAQPVPYPFANAAQMLAMAKQSGQSIAAMKRANEEVSRSRRALDSGLDEIWRAMAGCIKRGLSQEGILPGGLKVRRRAAAIHRQLAERRARNESDLFMANDWLAVFAMAVNEENAAGGRVVTAPTNGAAGVIPAVLCYARELFTPALNDQKMREFLLTAAAIGGLIKTNASISGAEVGCQGEVGSASAMAAAGLCAVMGGTPEQIENAAEIALEHHLGMTCDPVAGLVQIPCIERNAFGAVKAVTAASLAMKGDGVHAVTLDACIETMRQTGRDMDEKYRETSLGGLAVNVAAC